MANTTNFNWETPDDTDLVKDGAAAIRTLGNSIDTSFVDLKGGTTGQVLSKASNTDLDFTWVAQDDSNAIQNALLTTTGDTIYASSASTPARLAIGSSGQVLTVSGGVPTWATPSAGAFTSLASGTLSGTTVTLDSISGSYLDLYLVITDFYASSNAYMRISVNNTTGIYAQFTGTSGSNPMTGTYLNQNREILNSQTDNFYSLRIFNYANATSHKRSEEEWITGDMFNANQWNLGNYQDAIRLTSAITRLDITASAGTWSAGAYTLYGVK